MNLFSVNMSIARYSIFYLLKKFTRIALYYSSFDKYLVLLIVVLIYCIKAVSQSKIVELYLLQSSRNGHQSCFVLKF